MYILTTIKHKVATFFKYATRVYIGVKSTWKTELSIHTAAIINITWIFVYVSLHVNYFVF